jgi:hypothetical protein
MTTPETQTVNWERPCASIHPLLILHKSLPHFKSFQTLSKLCESPLFDFSLLQSGIAMGENPVFVISTLLSNPSLSISQFIFLIENYKTSHTLWWFSDSKHVFTLAKYFINQEYLTRNPNSNHKSFEIPFFIHLKFRDLPPTFFSDICSHDDFPFDLLKYVFYELNHGSSFHPFNTKKIGHQNTVDFEFIDKYFWNMSTNNNPSECAWDIEKLAKNPLLRIDFLLKHHKCLMDTLVDRNCITYNKGIQIQDILAHPELRWDDLTLIYREDYKTNEWLFTSPAYKTRINNAIMNQKDYINSNPFYDNLDIMLVRFLSKEDILNNLEMFRKAMRSSHYHYSMTKCLPNDVIVKCFQTGLFTSNNYVTLEVLPIELLDMGLYLNENLLSRIENVMELFNSKQHQQLILDNPKFMSAILNNKHLDFCFVETHLNKFNFNEIIKRLTRNTWHMNSNIPWELILAFTNLKYDQETPKWQNVQNNRISRLNCEIQLKSLKESKLFWCMNSVMFEENIESIIEVSGRDFGLNPDKNQVVLTAWIILALHQMFDFAQECKNSFKQKNVNIFHIYNWYQCNRPQDVIISRYKDLVECILPKVLKMLSLRPLSDLSCNHLYLYLESKKNSVIPFEFIRLIRHGWFILDDDSEIDFPKLEKMMSEEEEQFTVHHGDILISTKWETVVFHPNFVWDLLEKYERIRHQVLYNSNQEIYSYFPISLIAKHPHWPWHEASILQSPFTSDMTVYLLQQAINHSSSPFLKNIFVQGGDCGIINNIIEMATGLCRKDRAQLSLYENQ